MPPKRYVGCGCDRFRLWSLGGNVAAERFCVSSHGYGTDLFRFLCASQALTCPCVHMLSQLSTIRSDLLAIGVSKGNVFLHESAVTGYANPGTDARDTGQ